MRAQVSVEFLFGLALVLGFMVMIAIPALQEFELSTASAAARIAVTNFTSFNSSVYSTGIVFDRGTGRDVSVRVGLVYRPTQRVLAVSDSLKREVAASIQAVVGPGLAISGPCASSSSFSYCVV